MPVNEWSEFSQEAADEICAGLMEGLSVRSICKSDTLPSARTVFKWLSLNVEFAQQYARAREVQAEVIFDEMLDIADDSTNDWMERFGKDNKGYEFNGEAVRRTQMRIDARKWVAGKLKPKKYGDKVTLGSDPENPLLVKDVSDADRAVALLAFMAKTKGA